MTDCVICGHPQEEHYGSGCSRKGILRGTCACTYLERPPLPPEATIAEHRERAEWWHTHAQTTWELALEARFDLDRWYPLMRFYRSARRAEIDERQLAEARQRTSGPVAVPVTGPELRQGPELAERAPALAPIALLGAAARP